MKTNLMDKNISNLEEAEIIKMEQDFLDRYYSAGDKNPLLLLLKMCRGYYGKLIVSAVFCVLQLSALLYIPIASANIIDAITIGGEGMIQKTIIEFAILAFLLLINYPLQIIYMRTRNDAMRSIEVALRGAIITKLQRLTIQFNKEMESGRIHSKIIRDVESIRTLIHNLHTRGVHIVVNVVTIVAVLLIGGNWQVLVFFVLCAPFFLIIKQAFRKKLREENSEYRKTMEHTSAKVVDMVNLIPVTKAHGLESYEIGKMTGLLSSAARAGFRVDDINNRFGVATWLIFQVFRFACLGVTVYLTCIGEMTIGQLTLCQTYFVTFLGHVSELLNLMPIITAGTEAVNSIGEILGSNDVESDEGKIPIKDLKGEFDFKNVVFEYRDGNRAVLSGLDLSVKAGEKIALVGESGSGKSTIVNLVTAFYLADSGTVTVDGKDMKDIDLRSYRKHIAVVPQNSILFSGSVRENITYGSPDVSEEKLNEVIELACLKDVIEDLPEGIDTVIGERGAKLSGGQCQRVSIARALIRDPKVIIFDEATSALDTVSEKHIQQAIDNLSKDKTTFIVAHRLSTVKNADKIAVIKAGRCIECGTYDELIAQKGEFYKFRNLQV